MTVDMHMIRVELFAYATRADEKDFCIGGRNSRQLVDDLLMALAASDQSKCAHGGPPRFRALAVMSTSRLGGPRFLFLHHQGVADQMYRFVAAKRGRLGGPLVPTRRPRTSAG